MNTYEIEEKIIGQPRKNLVRDVQGTDIRVFMGRLEVWNGRPGEERSRLVGVVALERLVGFKTRSAAAGWDGVDRRVRPVNQWNGVDRRTRTVANWHGIERRAS
jgi:hypothetical protein